MARPTFLVVEPEPVEALSTRKLVLETAKYNVITAHSGEEALHLQRNFPNVDACIVVDALPDMPASELLSQIKRCDAKLRAIVLRPNPYTGGSGMADEEISSHDPHALVERLRVLYGDPRLNEP